MADAGFEDWLDRQARVSAAGVAACISATGLTKRRTLFGQTIVPLPGSVLASPVTDIRADEPDYFFHWVRDSVLIMDAVLLLARTGDRTRDWVREFGDILAFEQRLGLIDGRRTAADGRFRIGVDPSVEQFLRPDDELAAIHGDAVPGDVRYNVDGTIDTIRWSRPQHDGPALRALVCLRFLASGLADDAAARRAVALISSDLNYSADRIATPGYDIWEEISGDHYYTRVVQFAALRAGADWARHRNEPENADRYAAAAGQLAGRLDAFWSPAQHSYAWSLGDPAGKHLDFSSVLAVLHTGLGEGAHSVRDDRAVATLAALEAQFAASYPINLDRPEGLGLATGRYIGDRYVSAGPWFLCTFGAAEFRYRRAAALGPADCHARALVEEADQILRMARRSIPESGALTEQFDPKTGQQTSARDLGWSHAAFLTARNARVDALGVIERPGA